MYFVACVTIFSNVNAMLLIVFYRILHGLHWLRYECTEMGKFTNFGDLEDQDQDHQFWWSWRSRSRSLKYVILKIKIVILKITFQDHILRSLLSKVETFIPTRKNILANLITENEWVHLLYESNNATVFEKWKVYLT